MFTSQNLMFSLHTAMAFSSCTLICSLCLLFLSEKVVFLTADHDPSFNFSSFSWATAKGAEELDPESEFHEHGLSLVEEGTDADSGGFSSLEGMLQWAIGNSDPETLKGAAQEVQNLSPSELEKRQAEIKDFMEELRMPSDAELMKIAIADLQNSSLSVEYRQRALQELLELVEPIDNANDLSKLGGLAVVAKELNRAEEELRISAAWVLGKASQNNGLVQSKLLELGVLPRLVQMVQSSCAEESVKALYAVSALIRNNPTGQVAFYYQGGALLLEDLMKNASSDIRLRRKSLFLVADMAEQQQETGKSFVSYQPTKNFLMAVVNLMAAPDLDTQEKALMAIRSLANSSTVTYKILQDDCKVTDALEELQLQLDELMHVEDQADFAREMQALCQLVKSMFSKDHEAKAQ